MTTLTCSSFKATPVPGGQIRLEISDPTPDALLDKMYLSEIATALGKTKKQVDKLSRRAKNPLPLTRGLGRPFALRTRLNEWLSGQNSTGGKYETGVGPTWPDFRRCLCGAKDIPAGCVYCPQCQP